MTQERRALWIIAASLAALVVVAIANPPLAVATSAAHRDYVGATGCRGCHTETFDIWENGPHARAFTALTGKEREDPQCLQCHTMLPSEKDPIYAGIQCETCHGAGRFYSPSHVMRDEELRTILGLVTPDESTCKQCHTEDTPSIHSWDYERMSAKIKHWSDKENDKASDK